MALNVGSLQALSGSSNPSQITCEDITTAQIDKNFKLFLARFRNDGTANKYGVLLLNSMPSSRPRPHDSKVKHEEPASLVVIKSTATAEGSGIYTLEISKKEEPVTWVSIIERQSRAVPPVTDKDIFTILKDGGTIGDHVRALEGNGGTRVLLGLKKYPFILSRLPEPLDGNPGCDSLNSSVVHVRAAGSLVHVDTPPAGLTKVIYHHRGQPQTWIVVGPADNAKLEDALWKRFNTKLHDGRACPQSLGKLSLFVTPDTLHSWGIFFTQVTQSERQTMVIFEGSYFWGYSTGFAALESKNFAEPNWVSDRHRLCSSEYRLCSASITQTDDSAGTAPRVPLKRRRVVEKEQQIANSTQTSHDQTGDLPMREFLRECELDRLCNENSNLRYGMDQLVAERDSLLQRIAQLGAENEQLLAHNGQLWTEINQLQRSLASRDQNLNDMWSSNQPVSGSSMPGSQ